MDELLLQKTKTMICESIGLVSSILTIVSWLCMKNSSENKVWEIVLGISMLFFCMTSIVLFGTHLKDKQKNAQIVALERDGHLHSARMVFLSDSPQDTTRADVGNQNKFHAKHSEYRFKIGPANTEKKADIEYDFLFEFTAEKNISPRFQVKDKNGKKKYRINFVPYFFGDENFSPQNFRYTLGKAPQDGDWKEFRTGYFNNSKEAYKYVYEPGAVECVVGDPGLNDLGDKHFLSCKDCDGQNDIYKYPFGDYTLGKDETCHLGFTYERHRAFFWNNPVELFVLIPRLFCKTTENSAKITIEFEDIPKTLNVDVSLEEYPMKLGCKTRLFYFDREIQNENGRRGEVHTIDTANFKFNRNSIYAIYIHHKEIVEADDKQNPSADGPKEAAEVQEVAV